MDTKVLVRTVSLGWIRSTWAKLVLTTSVALWVKHWPTDLVDPYSSPAQIKSLNEISLHTAFHYYLPIILMTEILLKRI